MDMNTRTLLSTLCVLAGALAVGAEATAQQPGEAMLQRIFASGDFAGERFGPARWLDGGSYLVTERSESPRGSDLVKVDAATGAREVLVPARQLVPPGDSAGLAVEDFAFSADLSKLIVFTNSQKVWRQNTRGDYWVLDRAAGTLRSTTSSSFTSTGAATACGNSTPSSNRQHPPLHPLPRKEDRPRRDPRPVRRFACSSTA
jgi:dipeptidyl-peptidase-4